MPSAPAAPVTARCAASAPATPEAAVAGRTHRIGGGSRHGRPNRRARAWPGRVRAAAAAALVHPPRLGRAPRHLPGHGRPARPAAPDAGPVRAAAPDDGRAPLGPGARGDPRLLRGGPQPGHARDERLGRGRAGLVAEPPRPTRGPGHPEGRRPLGARPRRPGRRAPAPLGRLPGVRRLGRRHRRLRAAAGRPRRRWWCSSRGRSATAQPLRSSSNPPSGSAAGSGTAGGARRPLHRRVPSAETPASGAARGDEPGARVRAGRPRRSRAPRASSAAPPAPAPGRPGRGP